MKHLLLPGAPFAFQCWGGWGHLLRKGGKEKRRSGGKEKRRNKDRGKEEKEKRRIGEKKKRVKRETLAHMV